MTGPLTPAQTDQLQADREAAGYPRTPLGTAPTAEGQAAADAATAAREGETTRQKDLADAAVKGLPLTGNIFTGPLPGSPGNRLGEPYDPGAVSDMTANAEELLRRAGRRACLSRVRFRYSTWMSFGVADDHYQTRRARSSASLAAASGRR